MFLLTLLKTQKIKLPQLSLFTSVVLVVLSALFWYPTYSDAYVQKNKNMTTWLALKAGWKSMRLQGQRIEKSKISGVPWGSHSIYKREQGLPSLWLLEGEASLADWHGWLEWIQDDVALSLESIEWHQRSAGKWLGRLLLKVEIPLSNRAYQDWLPANGYVKGLRSKDWQFISTMTKEEGASALLAYKTKWHWVTVGSWLPEAGVTVLDVSFDSVTVQAQDGSKQTIRSRSKEAKHD